MTDYPPDTPNLATPWCPTCQPDKDITREILEVRFCAIHEPNRSGPDDVGLGEPPYLSGNQEIDPETNRAYGELFHRGHRRKRKR